MNPNVPGVADIDLSQAQNSSICPCVTLELVLVVSDHNHVLLLCVHVDTLLRKLQSSMEYEIFRDVVVFTHSILPLLHRQWYRKEGREALGYPNLTSDLQSQFIPSLVLTTLYLHHL